MTRLVCIVEIPNASTEHDAQKALDAFRETVQPTLNYGITIYRATATTIPETAEALIEDGVFEDSISGHAAALVAADLLEGWSTYDEPYQKRNAAEYQPFDVGEVIEQLQAWQKRGYPAPIKHDGDRGMCGTCGAEVVFSEHDRDACSQLRREASEDSRAKENDDAGI